MATHLSLAEVDALVLQRKEWRARGWSERGLARAIDSGEILRLSRTHSVSHKEWEQFWPEQRLLARVFAAAPLQRGASYFCRESAAVLHGLPLYRFSGQRAQVLIPKARSSHHSRSLERHVGRTEPEDLGQIRDIPCTSIERTLIDLARFSSAETGIMCIDRAMRQMFPTKRGEEPSAESSTWLRSLMDRVGAAETNRGKARATHLLALADPGSESPLESVARLRFVELGYRVLTQAPVPAPGGGHYFADLELVGANVLVEVDGRGKYTDEELRQGRSIDEVILREKRREEWNRARTGKRMLRVIAADLASPDALRTVLREQRIPPPNPSQHAPH